MSNHEVPVQKQHLSGSWRAVHSLGVPASESLHPQPMLHTTARPGGKAIQRIEETAVPRMARVVTGYLKRTEAAV